MSEFSNPDSYEFWMGRWSALLAPKFVEFADLPPSGRFLDVGSGTGMLSAAIVAAVKDARVVGIEPAKTYVAYCRKRFSSDRLSFNQGNALDIPFENDEFDGALSLLAIHEISDAPKAVQEMRRVTRPGGYVTASQWNFKDGMLMLSLFWDAMVETIDAQSARDAAADCMIVDYPDEEALKGLWEEAGLIEVETRLQKIEMAFNSFDDYWMPFLTGVSATSLYTQKLSQDQQNGLRQCLWEKIIGQSEDRPFTLNAQAWAVKGLVSFG